MAQPTKYTRQAAFANFQANNPATVYAGTDLDNEFNAVKTTTDAIVDNLALIQADDGRLKRNSVGADQLKAEISIGFNEPTDWLTATAYAANDYVWHSNVLYRCLIAHTSGTFATDLAALDWVAILDLATPLTAAAASETAAASSATTASSAATSASGSATTATSQATAASNSAAAAAASATSAAASAGAFNGAPVDVASATTTDIGAAGSANIRITGTTTITGLGTIAAGTTVECRFAGVLTLTHSGTALILPGAADITTTANDNARFMSLGSGNWICTKYKRAGTGSLASLLAGTGNNNVVQLDGSAKLPAVDGSALTNVAGGLKKVSTQTVSGQASIAWTGLTKNNYLLLLDNITLGTTTQSLLLQFGTGGTPTWLTSSYEFHANQTITSNTAQRSVAASGVQLNVSTAMDTSHPSWGRATIMGLTDAVTPSVEFAVNSYSSSATEYYVLVGAGDYLSLGAAVTALRLIAGSGNISGTATLFEIVT